MFYVDIIIDGEVCRQTFTDRDYAHMFIDNFVKIAYTTVLVIFYDYNGFVRSYTGLCNQ